jgi:hypothetical protein
MPIIIGCKSQDGTPTAQAQSAFENFNCAPIVSPHATSQAVWLNPATSVGYTPL